MDYLKEIIESAWEDRDLLKQIQTREAICEVVSQLDRGLIRIAANQGGEWITFEWIKKAVILYFPIMKMEVTEVGPFQFYDKIPLKTGYDKLGIRVVPHAIARYGAFIAEGVIMMPSYINIGAFVDTGTMIDTWATVG
ncbi:MAG: 2,3,4,5-tetrahydropyridine-2,6-dicarboxylate N-succinyltransferase, partial [Bacteroidota bacterium]